MIRNRYRSLRLFAMVVQGNGNELTADEVVENIEFSPEELEMYAAFIHRLTPPEFIKLVRTGHWEQAEAGHILVAEGGALDRILFIGKGQAEVASKGKVLQRIEAGSFVGEMEFLAGGPAFATVTAVSPMHYIAWQRDDCGLFQSWEASWRSYSTTLWPVGRSGWSSAGVWSSSL